jgi:hypothetical protein
MKQHEPGSAKHAINPECWKVLEDTMGRSPFSIAGLYLSVKEENNHPLTVKERMHIIEKALNDINPMDLARFKISGARYNELMQSMTNFETIGRSEKNLMTKLK